MCVCVLLIVNIVLLYLLVLKHLCCVVTVQANNGDWWKEGRSVSRSML